MLQKVQEAVNTSQAWIYLSRGEPKDTPDPPCLFSWGAVQCPVGNAVAASQDLPHSECPRVCAVQERNHRGEQERWKFSLSEACPALKATKSSCHTSPCRKSSMLSGGRQGAQSQLMGRMQTEVKVQEE